MYASQAYKLIIQRFFSPVKSELAVLRYVVVKVLLYLDATSFTSAAP